MANDPDQLPQINPLAQTIRDAAASSSDPKEVESLLRSAEKVEEADRRFKQSHAELLRGIENAKTLNAKLGRKEHLPWWAVVLVLSLFFAFLVYVAVKHYV
jgi:hypothetical protein